MSLKVSSEVDKPSASVAEAAQMAIEAGAYLCVRRGNPAFDGCGSAEDFAMWTPRRINAWRREKALEADRRALAISRRPYRDVWISLQGARPSASHRPGCARPKTISYRYHEDWRQVRDSAKFGAHGVIWRAVWQKLRAQAQSGISHCPTCHGKKVLGRGGSVCWTPPGVRIGNSEYAARDNKSFGLTTLRNSACEVHSRRAAPGLEFFAAKGRGCSTRF